MTHFFNITFKAYFTLIAFGYVYRIFICRFQLVVTLVSDFSLLGFSKRNFLSFFLCLCLSVCLSLTVCLSLSPPLPLFVPQFQFLLVLHTSSYERQFDTNIFTGSSKKLIVHEFRYEIYDMYAQEWFYRNRTKGYLPFVILHLSLGKTKTSS